MHINYLLKKASERTFPRRKSDMLVLPTFLLMATMGAQSWSAPKEFVSFLSAVSQFFGPRRIAILTTFDQDVDHTDLLALNSPVAIIGSPMDFRPDGIAALINADYANSSTLLSELTHNTYLQLLPWTLMGAVPDLRLDSRVYFYKEHEDRSIELYEQYAIKSTVMVTQAVGKWSPVGGLSVPVPNAWSRRADLRGVTLLNGVLGWSVLTQVILEGGTREVANWSLTVCLPDRTRMSRPCS